ncbi:hypothetical protein, partial [Shewanella sp.]|uniref:hypothetical protein n=1 Tax=Shewanella sp. TaxID=50422 RepID=UPI00356860D6
DSAIQEIFYLSLLFNACLSQSSSKSISVDSCLLQSSSKSMLMDSCLFSTYASNLLINACVQQEHLSYADLQALIQKTLDNSISLDSAVLLADQIKTTNVDAITSIFHDETASIDAKLFSGGHVPVHAIVHSKRTKVVKTEDVWA